jgi:cobalt-zinc-cadmium efflux system protein
MNAFMTHQHHQPQQFNLAFGLAVLLNLLFTLMEAIYALSAHSMSLLADAGHNLGDVLGLGFAWGASWLAQQRASGKFSYGLKRSTILASLLNAAILMATAAIIAYEAMITLFAPAVVDELTVMIIAVLAIGVNGGTAILFRHGYQADLNIKAAFLHLVYDALISFAVVITGVTIYLTHWYWLDPLVGIAIVLTILLGTWSLLRDSVGLILDAVPQGVDQEAVRAYLSSIPGVVDLHDLHIWGLSTQEVALTCHLVVPDQAFADRDFQWVNNAMRRRYGIHHITLQIEKGDRREYCGQICR